MNIQQLEYLVAVDKHRHFGKAAQACFITQPTLSAMIQKLEDELDVRIFDRTTHPIRTTDAGRQIIDHASKILDEVTALRIRANELHDVVSGSINLGIIPTVSGFLLPGEIFDFLRSNPQIDLNIREMTTDNIIRSLEAGELDAGIISTPHAKADSFFSDLLFKEELMIYAADGELVKHDDSFVYPEDIDPDKVWLLEEGNCLRTQFENVCNLKDNSARPRNLHFQASNIYTLVRLVDRVRGITVMPELGVEYLNEEQQQRVHRFRRPFPVREISLIYYKPTYKQRLLDELTAFISSSLSRQLNYYRNPDDFVEIRAQ